jgi:hypothetical protein
MKKYGDVVVYLRNGVEINALVALAREMEGKEHLTLVYLDPAMQSSALTVNQLERGVAKAFDVVPLIEGALHGWKPVETDANALAEWEEARKATVDTKEATDDLVKRIAELEGDLAESEHQNAKLRDRLAPPEAPQQIAQTEEPGPEFVQSDTAKEFGVEVAATAPDIHQEAQ